MFAIWDLLSNVESSIYRPYAESARSFVYNLWVSDLSRTVGWYSSHVATLATPASLRLVSCWSPSLWDRRVAENCRCCEEWILSSWQRLIDLKFDVRGSVHHSIIHTEITNKMQKCIKILLFHVYMKLNMFRATQPPIIRSSKLH
jgi:hypothetical protein